MWKSYKRLKIDNRLKAIELREQGKTYQEIGDVLGVCRERVRQYLQEAEMDGKLPNEFSTEYVDQLTNLIKQRLSWKEIGEVLGVSANTAASHAKKLGLLKLKKWKYLKYIGKDFGYLKVLDLVAANIFLCKCNLCGSETRINAKNVIRVQRSCGCLKKRKRITYLNSAGDKRYTILATPIVFNSSHCSSPSNEFCFGLHTF